MLGPIDYIVVGFSGNNFDGSILEALGDAVDKDIIRVIDLLFIMKDAKGEIVEGEYEDQSDDIQSMIKKIHYLTDDSMPLITEADIAKIGEQMPADTAAAVLVIEHLWAKDLKKALMDANGILIADGRIHPEAIEEAVKELEAAKS